MIAPMKKVHLVLMEKDRDESLLTLRALGVVHLEPITGQGQEHEEAAQQHAEVERAHGLLASVPIRGATGDPAGNADGLAVALRALAVTDEIDVLQDELGGLLKERDRLREWGDFDLALLHSLSSGDLGLRVIECPSSRLATLPEEIVYVRLAAPKGKERLVLLRPPAEMPTDTTPFQLPVLSPTQVQRRIEEIEGRTAGLRAEMAALALHLHEVTSVRDRLAQELVYLTVRSGMESTGPLAYVSGYVPARDLARLQAQARRHAWALLADDPSAEDQPPTKVERPAAVRMIAPVFQFLGTVPGYREYDISSWFLIFFSLYFAMIFGDGGYGLILLLGGLLGVIKAKRGRRKLPDALRLLLLLATSTLGWGMVTATWFALPVDILPGFLRALSLPGIRGDNPEAATNIRVFCFVVGAAQLSVAHLKNIRRDFPNPKFLAQAGSLAMVIGMFTVVLNLIIDPTRFPIPTWALGLVGGGFLLVFVFGNWEGNLLRAILGGLQNIIPTFLGTVGVFADIASYIRLWAVGLAGVAISQTVNGMAAGMVGDPVGRLVAFLAGALGGLVLIVSGHGLNLVMTALSVVVHGIRLNMLEFSGHLGMEWSGYPYDPFRKTESGSQGSEGKETS